MDEAGWKRWTPHALVAMAVFGMMHVADEMYANWDAAAAATGTITSATMAALMAGLFTLVAMWALWWILTDRAWGYSLAAVLGLFYLYAGATHFLNTAEMTGFRWAVVVLQVVSAAYVAIMGASETWELKPWEGSRAAGA